MPRITIVPTDNSCDIIEMIAMDPAAALPRLARTPCKEADVCEDGDYVFSVRVHEGGFWTIFQRDDVDCPRECPTAS